MQSVFEYMDKNRQAFVDSLVEFLRIPTVSTKPEHQEDLKRAADWLQRELASLGFKAEIHPTSRHPIVYAEKQESENAPTVLFYGHYDVQPPEPLDLWKSGPFEPLIAGVNLYARGASDDKGQLFTHLKSIEAYVRTTGRLPVNVKVLFEGEEEIGSPNLRPFVEQNADLLKCDCVVISDTGMWAEGVPSLCYSLRGLVGLEVELRGPNRDLHSGIYGGAVPNPINQLCRIIARLHDEDGRVTIPGFYDDVLPLEDWERKAFASLGADEEAYRKDLELKALWGEKGYSALERRWARPTLDVNGMWGGYQGPGGKTVIPSAAFAKITMRLVPHQQPDKIIASMKQHLQTLCPESCELILKGGGGGKAVLLPTEGYIFEAAKAALREGFGRDPVMIREGGSIPVVATFSHVLKAPCVMLGFGLPDDNLHSPNEKFNLDNYHRGIRTVACFMEQLSKRSSG